MRVVLILFISLFLCMQGQLTAAYITKACASNGETCCQAGSDLTASSCCATKAPSNNKSPCQGSCHIDTESHHTHWQISSSASARVTPLSSYSKQPHAHIQAPQNVGVRSKFILSLRPQKRIYYSVWRLWDNLCSILFYSVLLQLSFLGQQSLFVVCSSWGSPTY